MPTPQKFHQYVEDLRHGVHNFSAHKLKAMLLNTAPDVAADEVKADLPAEISAGNGYTTGGVALTVSSSGQTGGAYKLVIADAAVTASGGSIGPARYVVVYNDTPTSPADPLVCVIDYGASFTLAAGETLDLDFSATNGLISGT
jgi:hypothetical protein